MWYQVIAKAINKSITVPRLRNDIKSSKNIRTVLIHEREEIKTRNGFVTSC